MSMYLIMITLVGPAVPGPAAGQVAAAFVANARPEDGVEHVAASLAPGRLHIGLFMLAPSRVAAVEKAQRLTRLVLDRDVRFRDWRQLPEPPVQPSQK